MTRKRIALITGATSGISETWQLLGTASIWPCPLWRRKDRLRSTGKEHPRPVRCDDSRLMRAIRAVRKSIASLERGWKEIVLINNAREYPRYGSNTIRNGGIRLSDINVKNFLREVRIFARCGGRAGRIINLLGSITGQRKHANRNVYCGSKFAVDAIQSGSRIDLNLWHRGWRYPSVGGNGFSIVPSKSKGPRQQCFIKAYNPWKEDIADLIIIYSPPLGAHVVIADLI